MVKLSDTVAATERTGTVEEYQGKKLTTPKTFVFDADQYSSIEEAQAAGDWPNAGQILKNINKQKVTSAKAAEYQKATKDLKEAYEASDDYKRKNFIDSAVAAGASAEQAEALSVQFLGPRVLSVTHN